jgi:hypothetical protein
LFRILFASLLSPLQKAQTKTASQMAPIDEFRSYEHYLQARQAVGESAANSLTPTQDQKIILIIIGVYIAAIMILWNMPIAKIILSPFKVCLM